MPTVPRYPYRLFWSDEDTAFVATCVEVPGLSGRTTTEAGAIDELKVAIGGWLEHLSEQGTPWPEPNPAAFSGVDAVAHLTADARHG
jgi:predicted RNase H-like HicB family nuclease